MVHLVITLTSGVQLMSLTSEDEALTHLDLVHDEWASPSALTHLQLNSDSGITDWVRLAHISAVRIAPAHLEEGADDAAGG